MTPVDPPDHTGMHRALDRISALAGQLADHDIQLLRAGIDHAEDQIRGLMDINTQQHEELVRWDLELERAPSWHEHDPANGSWRELGKGTA